MLNAVIRFALHNRLLIVAVSVAILVYGTVITSRMTIDVFPDLDRPRVVVITECPGFAAEEVETQVSFPLEKELLGAAGVQMVRSKSGPSLSVVQVDFDWGTNIYVARQVVQEKLTVMATVLPRDITPFIAPVSSIMGQILMIGVSRQPGPHGGTLTPLGKTPLLVEWVDNQGLLDVYLWDPRGDKGKRLTDPKQWQAVAANAVELVGAAKLQARGTNHFHGEDARSNPFAPNYDRDAVRQLAVTRGGQRMTATLDHARQAMETRTLADWVISPALRKVPGVAQITTMGGGRKQYQILVDPEVLLRHGVTLEDIEQALRKNNVNTSGGLAERANKEMPIRIFGRLGPEPEKVLADLAKIPVKESTRPTVLLENVAKHITEGHQFKRGDASVNGQPGVLLTVLKQPHMDSRRVTVALLDALHNLEESLPADIVINADVFQMKTFIDLAIFNVVEALVLGAILVLIVLFLFLLNFRTTFISLSAIPMSLAVSALVFRVISWLSGVELSINVMTLGGLAVAMGELVDDAIVDVENIFRRLRENFVLKEPRPVLDVIYEASVEVRSAIVFGTLMVILVFLPLFALSGMEGRLFQPLAVAYIVSILASLLVSLTLTPVLSYYLLPQARATHRSADSPLLRLMKWAASGLIHLSMARPGLLLVASWLGVLLAGWQLTRLGSDFLPAFDEGSVQVNITLPGGASLEASNKASAVADAHFRALLKTPENPHGLILNFVRRTGRAELAEHVDPVNASELVLTINPDSGLSRAEVLEKLRLDLVGDPAKNIPGLLPYAGVELEQPMQHLISHMLSGVSSQIAIKIYGDNLDTLRSLAEKMKKQLADVPGLASVQIEAQQNVEELQIKLRPDDLAYYGLDREHVAHFVETALQGTVVSQIIEGQRRFDLLLRLDEPNRTDFFSLGRLKLYVPGRKTLIMLKDIADIQTGYGPNYIERENARRRLVIRCNVAGRDQGSVVADIRAILDDTVLPAGYSVELAGQFQSQQEATWMISGLAGVSLVGMFFVLYMLYPSTRVALQILNALPTAFIGGVLALALTQQKLTVAALVGFISLGGIAARNGILLVTHYFHLMRHEGEPFSKDMILRGSLERLAPVLMTALTAGIALVPLVLAGHRPGREILYPVATVILGGLVTSTLCEFLIHPGIFWRYSGKDAEKLAS